MINSKEKGFTLAELLVVILIIAILATLAIVFFTGQDKTAKDTTAESHLRSALQAVEVEYLINKETFTEGPLATGDDDQERAENFVVAAIEAKTNLDALVSATPAQGKVGVEMNPTGTEGTLYAQTSTGYNQRSLP